MVDRRTGLSEMVEADVRTHLGQFIYETTILRNVRYSALSGPFDRHEERLRAVESTVSGLASCDNIHKLQLATETYGSEIRKFFSSIARL